ncbi:MAG: T9SS type A sorting domain-containing protein [Bacteroidales bacterium]|nr:T9SS type A sorting domain-containing protein [Bacteroidales bacterium]
MKNLAILITFGIWTLTSFSQDYYPLIEDNKTWNVLNVNLVTIEPPFDTTYLTESFWTNGDTLVNSFVYKKVYSTTEENPVNWDLWCLMREDSNKKVWIRRPPSEIDNLMYDFTVEAGDSILVGFFEPVYIFVDSISIVTINQQERKKYWFSCKARPYYKETWIEGIGSDKGICWSGSASVVGGWFRLLCMSENQELIYANPNYESCYLITEINETENPLINIYPNPAKNTLIIEHAENFEVKSISILNKNGQEIKQFVSSIEQLDLSEIKSGMYFIKISLENGQIVKKIVIEK